MNYIGVVAAASAFLSIWMGHVLVRKIEFAAPSIWTPALGFFTAGLIVDWLSTEIHILSISVTLGIFGTILLWDALEFVRQEHRVFKGHAAANPANPRHAAFLAAAGSAATVTDLLKREPVSSATLSESSRSLSAGH